LPLIGDPERHPVRPLPFPAAGVPADVPVVEELAPGEVWPSGAEFGATEFGVALSGEVWPG
jgi:hypothetical protein